MKDFDQWNDLKKNLENRIDAPYCNVREIWWCCIGLNIGSEQDGRNEMYERPVLVLEVFNKEVVRVAPITSKSKSEKYGITVEYSGRRGL